MGLLLTERRHSATPAETRAALTMERSVPAGPWIRGPVRAYRRVTLSIVRSFGRGTAMSHDRNIGRREVTLGMVAAAFGAMLPRGARAADSAKGVNCLTILYPAGEGLHFDADYYRDHHLTLIMKLYTNTIQRFELRTVAAAQPPAAYAAAVNIWINDLAAFQANNQKHGKTLTDDVPHFTNGMPTIQFDTVEGESGAKRSAPQTGDTCLTILYPNKEDAKWDVDYYRAHHMPLIMKLYGAQAIK